MLLHNLISEFFMRTEEALKKTSPRQLSGTANLRSRDMRGRSTIWAVVIIMNREWRET